MCACLCACATDLIRPVQRVGECACVRVCECEYIRVYVCMRVGVGVCAYAWEGGAGEGCCL